MIRYGVLRAVSARDRGLCGALGYRGGSGLGLMWGDRRPVRIGNRVLCVRASWV